MRTKQVILSSLILLAVVAGCDRPDMMSSDPTEYSTGEARDAVYCPAVEARVSPEDCEDLTRADAEVRTGEAAFNVPDPMRRGEAVEVHLVVDRRSPKAIRVIETGMTVVRSGDLMQNGDATASGQDAGPTPVQVVEPLEGRVERFPLPVGRHMRAELIGEGFEIVAKTEAVQEIPLGAQASWIWTLTARKGGVQSLILVTVVEGLAGGRRFVLARTPKVRTVTVEVSMRDWIWELINETPAWIKAVTAVVVAIGGLLTALYAVPWRRRRRAGEAAADAATRDRGNRAAGGRPDERAQASGEPDA
jgi:hypothetical protein